MSEESPDPTGSTGDEEGDVPSPPRPGPDVLYGETPTPPPLENGDGWEADPLMVSGSEAYVEGEYLYQDYIYDDHGADTRSFLSGPPDDGEWLGGIYSQPTGDFYYPNDPERYAYNAADLLEFRARPTEEGVAYRVTLNTMLEPDAAAVAIGVDTGEGGDTEWGYGLGDLGAEVTHRVVTWGTGAELDGEPLDDERVSVDTRRNQIEVEVPLDPGEETWRHYVVVGLWDGARERFQQVAPEPDERTPGGGTGAEDDESVPPVFNVGFRFEEPYDAPLPELFEVGKTLIDTALQRGPSVLGWGSWREHRQAQALAERDISEFHADVDFGALRADETDRSRVPQTGYLSLLYPSRHDFGEGVDPHNNRMLGDVQPYSAYVPSDYDGEEAPLVTLLHSLGGSYNQYGIYTPNYVRQLGEDQGAVVLMPQSRGPGGWFKRYGEVDLFEAMRDLHSRFPVDMDRVSLAGYSMGAYGTLMLAAQYPDVFGRGFAVVGPPAEDPLEGLTDSLVKLPSLITQSLFGGEGGGKFFSIYEGTPENALRVTDNLRHVPLLLWNGVADPLVPVLAPANYADRLRKFGYRHELDVFTGTHLLLVLRDHWRRGGQYLAAGEVARNPARVTYRRVPEFDHPELGLVHDGSHWVSDIEVAADADSGVVDTISLADGYAEPTVETFHGTGTSPLPHKRKGVRWGDPDPGTEHPPENALGVTFEGVDRATLWVEEAGLDPDAELRVTVDTDREATLVLAGSFGERELAFEAGETTRRVTLGEEPTPVPEE